MKILVLLVALLALVGSAMAWNISDQLTYKDVKTASEEAGYSNVLPQLIGTQSGAYTYEPNDAYGDVLGVVANKLTSVTLDRLSAFPYEDATKANFYATLTQGGSADMALAAKDSKSTTPEIVGDATAYQNLNVGGTFTDAKASFGSTALIGMADVPLDSLIPAGTGTVTTPSNSAQDSKNFVITSLGSANNAEVDAVTHGGGLFNSANLGEQVTADVSQDWQTSCWNEPTYSGGIQMWANFNGASGADCSNPIMSEVKGTAYTSLFPSNAEDFAETQGVTPGSYGIGDSAYWNNAATSTGWGSTQPTAGNIPVLNTAYV